MRTKGRCLGVSLGVLLAGVAVAQPPVGPPVYQPPARELRGAAPITGDPPRSLKALPETRGPMGNPPMQPIFNLPGDINGINAVVDRAIRLGDVAPNYQRIADTLEKGFPRLADPYPSFGDEARRKVEEQNIRLAGIDPKDLQKDLQNLQPMPPVPNGPNGPNNNDGLKQTIDEINKIFKTQADLIRSIDIGSTRRLLPGEAPGEVGAGDGVVVIGGRTGLMLGLIPGPVYDHIKVPRDQGLLIKEVFPKTPAEAAGYKKNDILLELNGRKVPSTLPEFWEKVMRTVKNDTPFTGVVLRGGELINVDAMKINDRRVIPALPNERAPDLTSIIQVVPGINSDQPKTNVVPEIRMIRTVTRDGIVTTEFIPVAPPKK